MKTMLYMLNDKDLWIAIGVIAGFFFLVMTLANMEGGKDTREHPPRPTYEEIWGYTPSGHGGGSFVPSTLPHPRPSVRQYKHEKSATDRCKSRSKITNRRGIGMRNRTHGLHPLP